MKHFSHRWLLSCSFKPVKNDVTFILLVQKDFLRFPLCFLLIIFNAYYSCRWCMNALELQIHIWLCNIPPKPYLLAIDTTSHSMWVWLNAQIGHVWYASYKGGMLYIYIYIFIQTISKIKLINGNWTLNFTKIRCKVK